MIAARALAAALAVTIVPGTVAAAPVAPADPPEGLAEDPAADSAEDPADDPADDPAQDPVEDPAASLDADGDGQIDEATDDSTGAPIEPGAAASEAPPKPRRYVWGGTDIEATGKADAQPGDRAPGNASPDTDATAPGGYLGPNETKEVAPKDGERKLLIAYIVLPLGTLAMVSGAVATWLTHPDHCQDRLGSFGQDISPKQCRGLWILNIVRTTYGSMMFASGAVLLGLGLRERKRYREWKAKHGAFLRPSFSFGQSFGQSNGQSNGRRATQAGVVFGARF